MLLYHDLDTGFANDELSNRTHISAIEIKRGLIPINLIFHRGQIPRALASTAQVKFVVKENGKYDSDPVAQVIGFAVPATVDFPYTATLNTDTAAVRALLFVDGNTSNDKASFSAMAEILIREDEDSEWVPGATIQVTLVNRVSDDTDSVSEPGIMGPIYYSPAITALIGGEDGNLDFVETPGVPLNQVRALKIGTRIQFWQLLEDPDAIGEEGVVVIPLDFDAEENPRAWKLLIEDTAVVWGGITGDINDQVDLLSAITAAVNALISGAPGALDTLNELAAALGDDANFAATVTSALAAKAALASTMGVVVHGAVAGTARPSGYEVVTWIGSVEPTNAIDNDIWEDTSA